MMKRVYGITTIAKRLVRISRGSVVRKPMTYAKRNGWVETSMGNFAGSYRVGDKSWRGKILPSSKDGFDLLIHNPPMDLIKKTQYFLCFGKREELWYRVHHHGADCVSAGIVAVERVLEGALNPKR